MKKKKKSQDDSHVGVVGKRAPKVLLPCCSPHKRRVEKCDNFTFDFTYSLPWRPTHATHVKFRPSQSIRCSLSSNFKNQPSSFQAQPRNNPKKKGKSNKTE